MPIQTWAGDRLPDTGLGRALAASLLLHLMLLWPTVPARQVAVPATPLSAILKPAAVPVTTASMPDILPKVDARPAVAKNVDVHSPKTLVVAEPDAPAVQSVNVPSTAAPDSRSETLPSTQAAEGSQVQPNIRSALPPSEGVDAEGLRSYRLALAREARRFKRYPPQAVDASWEGTAEVQVRLGAGGIAEGVRLARSSGHAALDEAALAMLGQALPATPVPAPLRERPFAVDLPVVFELPR